MHVNLFLYFVLKSLQVIQSQGKENRKRKSFSLLLTAFLVLLADIWNILITIQRDATQSSLFIVLQVHSTCFGCQPHPSSGAHKTVTTASGTGNAVLCSNLPPKWQS